MIGERRVICDACTRLDRYMSPVNGAAPVTCTAFPNGIPASINPGGGDHRETLLGEPVFELDPGTESLLASWEREQAESWPV